jgi:NAD(P)H-hydrate epimerase
MTPLEIPFWLSRAEVRELDRRAIEEFGVPGIVLMENAGRGAAELLMRLNPERLPVLILCGPGNNGGDGFVMARHLDIHGWPVGVRLYSAPERLSGDAAVNYRPVARSGIESTVMPSGPLPRSTWIVDALFGTGLTRPLTAPFDDVAAAVNASGNPVLAVDIPSGLDCDTGRPLGPTIRATHTATFVAWKKGFLEPEARPWLGEVHVIDIGAPKKLVDRFRAPRTEG